MKSPSLCPTCMEEIVPEGMHCRFCLIDLLSGSEIGQAKADHRTKLAERRAMIREQRKQEIVTMAVLLS